MNGKAVIKIPRGTYQFTVSAKDYESASGSISIPYTKLVKVYLSKLKKIPPPPPTYPEYYKYLAIAGAGVGGLILATYLIRRRR